MKIIQLLIIILSFIGFAACTPSEVASFPPEIQVDSIKVDSVILSIDSIDPTGNIVLDTISVGKIVIFSLNLQGYYNNLDSFYLTNSDTSAVKSLYVIKNLEDNFSGTKSLFFKGKFIFLPKIKSNMFTFGYQAKKATNDLSIDMILFSDVIFEDKKLTNADTLKFKMVIK